MWLGSSEAHKPFFLKQVETKKFFLHGATLVLAFIVLLLSVLLVQEWHSNTRPIYLTAILMNLAAAWML